VSKQPRDQLLGHEDEADGIQEYDNPLPDWWLGLLWLTIIWAAVYAVNYHFIAHSSPQKALAGELKAAETRWPAQSAAAAQLVLTDEAAEQGAVVFKANCVPCHGADMKGGIGPNLLDDEWLHGGTPEQIHSTIVNGVPAKGMLSWGPILSADQINHVTAYIVQQKAKALGRPFPPRAEEEHPEPEEHDEHEGPEGGSR
jgi:cytochrome c oxidase cbb3-type subunit 3